MIRPEIPIEGDAVETLLALANSFLPSLDLPRLLRRCSDTRQPSGPKIRFSGINDCTLMIGSAGTRNSREQFHLQSHSGATIGFLPGTAASFGFMEK
jgi:hypothetical protein